MVLAVEIVLVATVVFVVAALAVGRFDRLAPAVPDGPHVGLGGHTVAPGDVEAVRFGMAVRGYRMAEVDAVLSRLAQELAWRDEELARRDDELLRLAELARVGGVGDHVDHLDAHSRPEIHTDRPEIHTDRPEVHTEPEVHTGPRTAPDTDAGLFDAHIELDAQGDARHDGPDRDEARGPRPVQDQPGEPGAASPDKGADG